MTENQSEALQSVDFVCLFGFFLVWQLSHPEEVVCRSTHTQLNTETIHSYQESLSTPKASTFSEVPFHSWRMTRFKGNRRALNHTLSARMSHMSSKHAQWLKKCQNPAALLWRSRWARRKKSPLCCIAKFFLLHSYMKQFNNITYTLDKDVTVGAAYVPKWFKSLLIGTAQGFALTSVQVIWSRSPQLH